MQNIDELNDYLREEDKFNIKDLLYRLIDKWVWFALFGAIGLALGYYSSKATPASYQVYGSMLINNDQESTGVDAIFEGFELGDNVNIENHLLMLKSYSLNQKALKNLNWDISWFKRDLLKDINLYKRSPFKVIKDDEMMNVTGLPLVITIIDNHSFLLQAEGEAIYNNEKVSILFEETLKFGEEYNSDILNFAILKNDTTTIQPNEKFFFIFNDLNELTVAYQSKLSVSQSAQKADGIYLSVIGENKQQEADFLNELIKTYIAHDLNQKNQASLNTVRFIDAQLSQLVDSLKVTGQTFTNFRSKKGIVDLSQEAGIVVERLSELESEKGLAERRIAYYQNLSEYMTSEEDMKHMVVPSVVGIMDASLNSQVAKLGELYTKRSSLGYVAKVNNPSMIMVEQEIKLTLKALNENIKNLKKHARVELKNLNSRIADINMELATLPQTEQELINIKRSFDLNNELYTFLLTKRAETAITTASNVSDAQIIDPARVETARKVGPKETLNLIIGLVLGLFIPFIVIVLSDYFDDTIKSKEELEKVSQLPVMGEIARNKYKIELPVIKHPRSGIAETFRTLRVNLLGLGKKGDPIVFAIHSMIPGEGKTFTSLNLASVIAMDNKKVLLVGCDLRKPRLHLIFKSENNNGLSTYLNDNDNLQDIIHTTELENLCYVNAGPIPPNPSELIGNGNFKIFLEEAKKQFDVIVLDNAPVSLVTDGFITGGHADVNLLVMRQNYSHKKQVGYVNQLAGKGVLKQLGLILNDTIYSSYGNRYGTYGYGNGYYDDDGFIASWKKGIINRS